MALSLLLGAAPPAAPQAAPPEPAFTVAAVGDVMLGSTFPDEAGLPPDDARQLLAPVASLLRGADLTIGNLEGPLLDAGESIKCAGKKPGHCYAFRVPTRYGERLKEVGFKVMGLANNHALDFGPAGWESSKKTLDALGIGHTGELGDIAHLEIKGRKVAVIGFSTYDKMYDLNDLDRVRREIEALKADGSLVVVSFHGGAEGITCQHVPKGHEIFLGEDRGDLRAFAHLAIDAGAALVIGHGPHVLRGLEVYKGRLIAYSLGNFATWDKMNLSGPLGVTAVLEVKLADDGGFLGGALHSARQDKPGGPKLDPKREAVAQLSKLSKEDFGEAAPRIAPDGALSPP